MSKEAMKLALEALEWQEPNKIVGLERATNKAITALREAPAEQPAQQEPVAWMTKDGEIYKHECWPEHEARPLVFGDTSPPPQRTWVGLTDEDRVDLWKATETENRMVLIDAIEAKLKEKNNG